MPSEYSPSQTPQALSSPRGGEQVLRPYETHTHRHIRFTQPYTLQMNGTFPTLLYPQRHVSEQTCEIIVAFKQEDVWVRDGSSRRDAEVKIRDVRHTLQLDCPKIKITCDKVRSST